MKLLKYLTLIAFTCVSFFVQAHENLHKEIINQYEKNITIPKVSVQLWSVKNELKRDFKGTLTQIADMGFDGVEFAGDFGPYSNDAEGLKAFLDGLGLEVSAAHVKFTAFDDENFDQSVAYFKALKTDTLIVAWDERAWDSQKVDSLITDLTVLFTQLKKEGFHFGFHNHDKEFNSYKGSTFWDHIAQSTPKDFVLQMDVGWVTLAEKDPVQYINRYPGRTLTTHIKAKLPKAVAAKMATNGKRPIIGDDVTDWLAVLKADIAVGGTKWFVVEQEEYPDGLTPLQSVKLSKKGLDKVMANL
jgi:sugar phosphate isomerase/epimerase